MFFFFFNLEHKTKAYEAYAAPATSVFYAGARNEMGEARGLHRIKAHAVLVLNSHYKLQENTIKHQEDLFLISVETLHWWKGD